MRAYKDDPDRRLAPKEIKEHLAAFCQQHIGKPVTLVGASLGGMLAIDFANDYPEVQHLSNRVLCAQCACAVSNAVLGPFALVHIS